MRASTAVIGSFAIACLLLSGCVSKGSYDDQVKKAKKLKRKLKKSKKTVADRDQKIKKLNTRIGQLGTELTSAGAKVSAAKKRTKDVATQFGKKLKATQKELEELARLRAAAEKRAKMQKRLSARFQKLIDAGKLSVKVIHGRMVLKLKSKVLFVSGKADLADKGKETLVSIAKALKAIRHRHFQVAGHTDNIPMTKGDYKNNWQLSAARAVEVVMFLQSKGVRPWNLSAAGFSQFQPVATNKKSWGRQLNRRIEITLLPSIPRQLVKAMAKKRRK